MSGKGNRWYPSIQQLKDPVAIERSFRQILDHVYRLQDSQDALAAAKPSGNGSGASASQTGPSTSVMLGLRVVPIDTVNEADGNVLTYVKANGDLEFRPVGSGGSGVTSVNTFGGVVHIVNIGGVQVASVGGVIKLATSLKRAPFTPDGVTTVWTLPSAQSGDIILAYNGQITELGVGYTIAGPVITTLLPTSPTAPAAATGDTLAAYYIPA